MVEDPGILVETSYELVENAGIIFGLDRWRRLVRGWELGHRADRSYRQRQDHPGGISADAATVSPTIAADDLIKQNPQALKKYQTPGIDPGVPQASPALNDLVRDRLSQMDAKKGFVLDGYPATKDQADHLETMVKELGLPRPIVILLDVPGQGGAQAG